MYFTWNIYFPSNIYNTFDYAAEAIVVIPFRVYIDKANSSVTSLSIQGPDITDGIEQIIEASSMPTDIFSLTGVKVGNTSQKNQLPAGVYVVNGKTVIIR